MREQLVASNLTLGTYIEFYLQAQNPKKKTKEWRVASKKYGGTLGVIKWFSRWRRYAFYPEPGSLFEGVCLRQIGNFTDEMTCERRNERTLERLYK